MGNHEESANRLKIAKKKKKTLYLAIGSNVCALRAYLNNLVDFSFSVLEHGITTNKGNLKEGTTI